jgi:hypothetical protein
MVTKVIWERLDCPGHDACRLKQLKDGWELHGTAAFVDASGPACIEYILECGTDWRFRSGKIRGWIAHREWDLVIARSDRAGWSVNDQSFGFLEGCVDLDLGFTPSTNLLHLRRANLRVGDAADIPVAWIDLPQAALTFLPQRYDRRSERSYWYESPTTNYSAMLEMSASGFAAEYPGLWRLRAETVEPSA